MRRRTHALAAVGVAVLLVIAGCAGGPAESPAAAATSPAAESTASSASDSTIRVVGSGSADAEPNQAVVRVAVVARGPDEEVAAGLRKATGRNLWIGAVLAGLGAAGVVLLAL